MRARLLLRALWQRGELDAFVDAVRAYIAALAV